MKCRNLFSKKKIRKTASVCPSAEFALSMVSQEHVLSDMCTKGSFRSACTSRLSYQSLRSARKKFGSLAL